MTISSEPQLYEPPPPAYFENDSCSQEDAGPSTVRRQRLLDKMRVLTTTLNSFSDAHDEMLVVPEAADSSSSTFDGGGTDFPRMTLPVSRSAPAEEEQQQPHVSAWDLRLLQTQPDENGHDVFPNTQAFTGFGELTANGDQNQNAHPQPPEEEFGGTSETLTRRISMNQASRRSQKTKMLQVLNEHESIHEIMEQEDDNRNNLNNENTNNNNSLAQRMSLTLPSSCFAEFGAAFDTSTEPSPQQPQQQQRSSKIHLLNACNPLRVRDEQEYPNEFLVGAVSRQGNPTESSHLQLVLPPTNEQQPQQPQHQWQLDQQLEKTPSKTRQLLTSCNPRHREEQVAGKRAFVPVLPSSVASSSRGSSSSNGNSPYESSDAVFKSFQRRSTLLAGCIKDNPTTTTAPHHHHHQSHHHVVPLPQDAAGASPNPKKKKNKSPKKKKSLRRNLQLVACINPLRESVPEEYSEEESSSLDKAVLQIHGHDIFQEADSVWAQPDPPLEQVLDEKREEEYVPVQQEPERVDSSSRFCSTASLKHGKPDNNRVDFPIMGGIMEPSKTPSKVSKLPQAPRDTKSITAPTAATSSSYKPFLFSDQDFDCLAAREQPQQVPKKASSSPSRQSASLPTRRADATPSPVRSVQSSSSHNHKTAMAPLKCSNGDTTPVRRNTRSPSHNNNNSKSVSFSAFEPFDAEAMSTASSGIVASTTSGLSVPPPLADTSKKEDEEEQDAANFFQPFVDFVDNLDGGGSVQEDEYSEHEPESYASICATSLGDDSSMEDSLSVDDDQKKDASSSSCDVNSISVQVRRQVPKVLDLQEGNDDFSSRNPTVPKSISALEVDRPVSPMVDEDELNNKFDPLPCACGSQEECNGISAAFYMLGDERAGYIQVPQHRPKAETHFDLETNRLREALLRPFHKDKDEPAVMEEEEQQQQQQQEQPEQQQQRQYYVANHHFHPGIISSQSTKGSTSILPMYISKLAMVSLDLNLTEQDRVLDGKGMPTGFYYVVPNYGVVETKADLKKAIKVKRIKLENSRRKRQQEIMKTQEETTLFGSTMTSALTTTSGLAWYDMVH